ncbi:hypothetical protein ALP64_202269 [Pseudomonas syringae pv. actinidiae]|nr:hypothetical protein ALP64_202269 [Pseudomonas syringae pv. actinidiae]BBI43512.1 hypothetical protein KPSA1B_102240 [Pseudomonas syringae pv. actinidiae]
MGGICRQMRGANTIHLHLGKDKGGGDELTSSREKAGKTVMPSPAFTVVKGVITY